MTLEIDSVNAIDAIEDMHLLLCDYATDGSRGRVNALHLLMGLSGLMVEASYMFEQPDEALGAMTAKIARRLKCNWSGAELPPEYLPAAYLLDEKTEEGRDVARHVLKRAFDEPHAFASSVIDVVIHNLMALEDIAIPRDESFRMILEFAHRSMVLELAAQELCDVLIDHKVGRQQWSLGDCISSLSGLSGYKVAVWYQATGMFSRAKARAQSQTFNSIVDVMTREAVRYGIAGGTDWTFGLPANDMPSNPPSLLVSGVLPFCEGFFKAVRAFEPIYQATACAKAAGRMLAVASGGEMPEISPVISKPLAISAMTESYRSLL
jgi:hypothetical protein